MSRNHTREMVTRSIRAMGLLTLVGLCVLFGGPALYAQTSSGQVSGTVTDTSGAVVPGANVTLTNSGTRIANTAPSNGSGNFIFINVQPGTYELSVELQGFKPTKTPPFQVDVNQTVTRMIPIEVGVSESVTVTVEAPMLQTASPELGTVITEKAVHDLPLNGRNFTQLLTLTPGATPVSTAQGSSVGFQDAVDELNQRSQHRPLPLDRLALGWFGAGQRLPHHPPMHFKLRRYALDGPNPELVLPPDLLEQLHLRSPFHPRNLLPH